MRRFTQQPSHAFPHRLRQQLPASCAAGKNKCNPFAEAVRQISHTSSDSMDHRRSKSSDLKAQTVCGVWDLYRPTERRETQPILRCPVAKTIFTVQCTQGSALLSWLGADQHPEGSLAVETLPEENFHFRVWPQEHQVSIDGKQLLPNFQASHLKIEYNTKETRRKEYLKL